MAGSAADDDRGQLARSLVELRRKAGLTQLQVVAQTGMAQAQLSRIERGAAVPSAEQARALGRLYNADPDEREWLVQAAEDTREGHVDARIVIQRGQTFALQQRFRRLEERSDVMRTFQPVMVPGSLQTPAYAAAVFGKPEDSEIVTERLRRGAALLVDDTTRHVLILGEGALRWHAVSPEVMAAQLAAIVVASRRPNVEVGIIDWRNPVDFFPGGGFHLYDATAVVVGTNSGTAVMTKARDVGEYRTVFDRLAAAAAWGDDARAHLERVAQEYRELDG